MCDVRPDGQSTLNVVSLAYAEGMRPQLERPSSDDLERPRVLEFFAGIGLARQGLEAAGMAVIWANDYSVNKAAIYLSRFGADGGHLRVKSVFELDLSDDDVPVDADVAWASSPCTDLSLAGSRGGLHSGESNAFWGFIEVLRRLGRQAPGVVVLENVVGLATSNSGEDLAAVIRAFNELGYAVDVLALDARRWLPQSRPRLFVVGTKAVPHAQDDSESVLRPSYLDWIYADSELHTFKAPLPDVPAFRTEGLTAMAEDIPLSDERWWSRAKVEAFVASLSPVQRRRLTDLRKSSGIKFRTAYRRTRKGVALWEIRPDDIAGCLRTARGGSSRQAIVRAGNSRVHVRWMSPCEYQSLMGATGYPVSDFRPSQIYFAFGDGVAVPAVEWLGTEVLQPLVRANRLADAGRIEAKAAI